jgi:hypothetical protein
MRGRTIVILNQVSHVLFSRWTFGAICCALAAITAAAAPQTTVPAAASSVRAEEPRDVPELADLKKRVEAFAALHRKAESTVPALSKEAAPEEIDRYQKALATQVVSSRHDARQGDLFTPQSQAYIKTLLARLFAHANKRELRETILDDNPGPARLTVNGRYPDQVPLATMPPEVLQALPELPKPLEYRFVGDALILLDSDAHLVVDFFPDALPK